MRQEKSIVKNYLYNMVYQLLAVIVPLITTPYVSRVLEADGLGVYSFVFSIVTYFLLFGRLGLNVYGQLKIAECRDDRQAMSRCFWEIFWARTVMTLLVSIGYGIMLLFPLENKPVYLAFCVCIAAQVLDISWLFQGLEEFRKIMIRDSLTKLASVILVLLLVRKKEHLVLYTVLVQSAVLAGNVSLWFRLEKVADRCSFRQLRIARHISSSLVYFIPTIATSVYTILDKSMLGWLGQSDFENGYYEQAHKIELILITVLTSLSTVTLPRLKYMFTSHDTAGARELMSQTLRLIICLAFPMMAGIFMVAPDLIPWFLGEGYERCIGLLQIFSVLMVVVGLDNIIGKQCLMATGRQKYYNLGVICGACINVLLNLLLIPRYQSYGAAIASVASELTILGVFLACSQEYVTAKELLFPAGKYLLGSAVMCAAVWGVQHVAPVGFVGLLLQAVTGVAVYAAYLLLIRDQTLIQFFKRKD